MSSYKKRAKSLKRTHRERQQLSHRKHLGLLEKHQDYVLRARDYHRKQAHLKILKEKARNRNPDEFYYKMVNSKLKEGCHVIPQHEEKYSPEELQLMKTQDIKYVQVKLSTEKKKIERLRASLHQIEQSKGDAPNSHVIFVDSVEDANALADQLRSEDDQSSTDQTSKDQSSSGQTSEECCQKYKELNQRQQRCKDLGRIVQKMTTKKQLMAKGHRIKMPSDGVNPPTYRWKKERKK